MAELTALGFDALTVERVAARAGVHKTTLYRRWGGRQGLVADAAVAARAGVSIRGRAAGPDGTGA